MKIAIIQMSLSDNVNNNVFKALQKVEEAAKNQAQLIVLPELFEYLYFCQEQRDRFFSLANSLDNHPFLSQFQALAAKYKVVLPISFFEKHNQAYFNSLAMIESTGDILGVYRKTHIPDGPCYQEKFYFNPGNLGFKTWNTSLGKIGTGICWDQWFPESARIMTLEGADLLIYPTAIGSEPVEANSLDTKYMWQHAMIGHSICNSVYVAAPNRIGTENNMTFYGKSFISDFTGQKIVEADKEESILYADIDLQMAQRFRAEMGFFRDRRPEHYKRLLDV